MFPKISLSKKVRLSAGNIKHQRFVVDLILAPLVLDGTWQ